MASHNVLGNEGEAMAVSHLKRKGFLIREQNWRFQKAEVDIIAQKGTLLAVIEVKTRSSSYFGAPRDFINAQKIKLLTMAVDQYIEENDLDVEVRFDVIGIIKKGTTTSLIHLEDAFYHF